MKPAEKKVVHQYRYGIGEVLGFEVCSRDVVWRIDKYISDREGEPEQEQRCFAANTEDYSPIYGGEIGNYNPRCSCCYLNFGHTEECHKKSVRKTMKSNLTHGIEVVIRQHSGVPADRAKWVSEQVAWLVEALADVSSNRALEVCHNELLESVEGYDTTLPGKLYQSGAEESYGYSLLLQCLLLWTLTDHTTEPPRGSIGNLTRVLEAIAAMQDRLTNVDFDWPPLGVVQEK